MSLFPCPLNQEIPTVLVLNAEGEVQQAGGFMPVEAMLQFLDQASGRG